MTLVPAQIAHLSPMPTKTLSNGLRVGNLTSGHTFEFEDGLLLDACEQDRVEAGKLDIVETNIIERAVGGVEWISIRMKPTLTAVAASMILIAEDLVASNQVDLIIVPLMMLEAIREYRDGWEDFGKHCVAIRKNGRDCGGIRAKVHIDRFCV